MGCTSSGQGLAHRISYALVAMSVSALRYLASVIGGLGLEELDQGIDGIRLTPY